MFTKERSDPNPQNTVNTVGLCWNEMQIFPLHPSLLCAKLPKGGAVPNYKAEIILRRSKQPDIPIRLLQQGDQKHREHHWRPDVRLRGTPRSVGCIQNRITTINDCRGVPMRKGHLDNTRGHAPANSHPWNCLVSHAKDWCNKITDICGNVSFHLLHDRFDYKKKCHGLGSGVFVLQLKENMQRMHPLQSWGSQLLQRKSRRDLNRTGKVDKCHTLPSSVFARLISIALPFPLFYRSIMSYTWRNAMTWG